MLVGPFLSYSFSRTFDLLRIVVKNERIQIFVIAVNKDTMSSSGSDGTGVTDEVRAKMLEEENIKLKSQRITLIN